MTEQQDPNPDVTAAPAARQGPVPRAKPSHLTAWAAACLLVAVIGVIALSSSSPLPVGRSTLTPKPDSNKSWSVVADSGHDILIFSEPALVDERGDSEALVTGELVSTPENEGRLETPSIQQALPSEATPREKHSVPRLPSKPIEPGQRAVSNAHTVHLLLARAERQMAAKQLTTPFGDAAFESYEHVLKLIPRHEGALEGIGRIKGEYKVWAEANKRRGNWKRAEANLEKALAIDSEDPSLRAALRALKEAQKRAEKEADERNLPWPLAKSEGTKRQGVGNSHAVVAQDLPLVPSRQGWRSSPGDVRSEDPMARPVSRFEEFERRIGIRR